MVTDVYPSNYGYFTPIVTWIRDLDNITIGLPLHNQAINRTHVIRAITIVTITNSKNS